MSERGLTVSMLSLSSGDPFHRCEEADREDTAIKMNEMGEQCTTCLCKWGLFVKIVKAVVSHDFGICGHVPEDA